MGEKAWAYYSSAADDEITVRENHAAYHRIWFRPRVLRNVTEVDFSTKILGHKTSMPIYIVVFPHVLLMPPVADDALSDCHCPRETWPP